MIFFIHYRPDDGEILGWGYGFDPEPIPGNEVALVEPFDGPLDPVRQKYDAAAKAVIAKNADEQRASLRPKLFEVQNAIFAEMRRTDEFMIVDYPISDDAFEDWKQYRIMLRDLSKHYQTPTEMIENWDAAPDGVDPISDFRKRLKT